MVLRRDGQRFERRQVPRGSGTWATRMVASEDRGFDRRPPGDGQRVLEGGWRGGAAATTGSTDAKTGHSRWGVHRLCAAGEFKAGQ